MSDSLREVLEPFAKYAEALLKRRDGAEIESVPDDRLVFGIDGYHISVGDLRRAAALRASTDAAPVAGESGDLAEVKSELEWLVSLAKDSVETAHAVKEIDASAAKVIAALSHPPATDTAQAEPVGLREALEEIAGNRTELGDRSDYARGWNDASFRFRQIARKALSTPPARTDEGEG